MKFVVRLAGTALTNICYVKKKLYFDFFTGLNTCLFAVYFVMAFYDKSCKVILILVHNSSFRTSACNEAKLNYSPETSPHNTMDLRGSC